MKNSVSDSTKIRRELGWSDEIPWQEGFRNTVLWYRDHEAWWSPLMARAQVNEAGWKS